MTEADLRLLDEYRRSFGPAYEVAVATIRSLGLEPTGRPAKSTASIVEKLKRESIRLVQMQDIAGCRILVGDTGEQERVISALRKNFPESSVIDRRAKPSFGYRAVHVVVKAFGKPVEVQIRTSLQHAWAELSEKLSDTIDPEIKYGKGQASYREPLDTTSRIIESLETREEQVSELKASLARLPEGPARERVADMLIEFEQTEAQFREELKAVLLTLMDVPRGPGDDLFDSVPPQ